MKSRKIFTAFTRIFNTNTVILYKFKSGIFIWTQVVPGLMSKNAAICGN